MGVGLLLGLVPSDARRPRVLHGHAGVQDVAPEAEDIPLGRPRPQQELRWALPAMDLPLVRPMNCQVPGQVPILRGTAQQLLQ